MCTTYISYTVIFCHILRSQPWRRTGNCQGVCTTSSGHLAASLPGSTASRRSTRLRSLSDPLSRALGPLLTNSPMQTHRFSHIPPSKTDSHVRNSKHFVEVMTGLRVEEDEMLVSFDVSSLFTYVPIDEAVQVIRDRLRGDETLVNRTTLSPDRVGELLEACLRSTYFCYGGEFYEQREGAAMGYPVSAVVANLYMEFFEELALKSAPSKPRLWKKYVDDTCCIVKKGTVEGLLSHLNSVRPSIRFTVEVEREGSPCRPV